MFQLRGQLTSRQSLILGVLGLVLLIGLWAVLAEVFADKEPVYESPIPADFSTIGADSAKLAQLDSLTVLDSIARAEATEFRKVYSYLPPPQDVFMSFGSLYSRDNLMKNTWQSVWLNIRGYMIAILVSVPIGFLIGLLPIFRGLFSKPIDSMRYLPLTAVTGLFMAWFGLNDGMKIAFLAVGIIVYLLPVVVQRIDEVKDVHLKTVFTLGANNWQTIKSVYFPSVFSRLIDDIRVLTAISWTYIIIAELVNNKGGIGAMIYFKARQGYLDKVFALLVIIIVIGLIQDKVFVYLDKVLFPHKYYKQQSKPMMKGIEYARYGVIAVIIGVLMAVYLAAASIGQFGFIIILIGLAFVVMGELSLRKAAKS